ncbi:MAG: response regulator [Planctomycetes bacterium]|nr:response regulator [Planctomycetota bacterium]
MRLEALTPGLLQRAIAIYQDLAYGKTARGPRAPVELPAGTDPDALLGVFQKEVVETVPGFPCHRYSLRLGNRNYPFMKLLLQEHLVVGEFFFAVDSHDQMEIKPDYPDYEAWMALRRFNRELKLKIENEFAGAGLDTCTALRDRVAASCEADGTACRGLVLVVDDEEDLAGAVESLLSCRGYRIYKVHDGKAAVAATAELLPDLVLLDYELPELDGLQVIARLRADPATAAIPILLSSAGRVSMADIKKADGFLSKPFPAALLYEMMDRVLKTRTATPAPERPEERPQ